MTDIEELRKACVCLYIAVEPEVARNIQLASATVIANYETAKAQLATAQAESRIGESEQSIQEVKMLCVEKEKLIVKYIDQLSQSYTREQMVGMFQSGFCFRNGDHFLTHDQASYASDRANRILDEMKGKEV